MSKQSIVLDRFLRIGDRVVMQINKATLETWWDFKQHHKILE